MSDNQRDEFESNELADIDSIANSVAAEPNNAPENGKKWLPPSLYLILAVLIALCVTFPFFETSGPDLLFTIYISFALSLSVLLAILSSVKQRWWFYVGSAIALLVDGFVLAILTAPPSLFHLLIVLLPLFVAIPVVATLEFVKLKWGRFSKAIDLKQSFSEGLQFKISHLLIMTTVVAIGIATLQVVAPSFRNPGESMYFVLSNIVVLLSTIALVNVWAVLGEKIKWRVFVSLLVATLVLGAALMVLRYTDGRLRGGDYLMWGGMTVITWSTSLIQMYLLRYEGYRFVKR